MTKQEQIGEAGFRISQEISFYEQIAKRFFGGFRTIPGQPSDGRWPVIQKYILVSLKYFLFYIIQIMRNTGSNKKADHHQDNIIKADRTEHVHKITSPEQDTAVDLIRWVLAVAKLPADSPRFNYYVSRWRVPEKIERAKAEGTFDALISKCPPIDPAWVRLVPAALAAYADFAGIKPPKPEPTFSSDAIKIIKPKRCAAT